MNRYFENLITKIDEHEIFVMSSALAYATALALAPFILIILSLISFLDQDLQRKFAIDLTTSFGGEVGSAVKSIMQNVDTHPQLSGLSGIIGFVILIISASAIFTHLRIALDKINEYTLPADQNNFMGYLRNKFWSLGLVLGFAFLSIASMLVTALITVFYPNGEGLFWHGMSFIVNFFLFTALFTSIFRFIPSEKLDWRHSLFSGAVSTVFYLIGKSLISLYLGKAGLGSPYGAAGSLIVFLAWVYYTALTLLLSYEICRNILFLNDKKNQPIGKPPVSAKIAPVI